MQDLNLSMKPSAGKCLYIQMGFGAFYAFSKSRNLDIYFIERLFSILFVNFDFICYFYGFLYFGTPFLHQ